MRLLAAHPLPDGCVALWSLFLDLDRWRGTSGMGPMPLTLHDVEAYERRHGVTVSAADCDALKTLDFVKLTAMLPKKGSA